LLFALKNRSTWMLVVGVVLSKKKKLFVHVTGIGWVV